MRRRPTFLERTPRSSLRAATLDSGEGLARPGEPPCLRPGGPPPGGPFRPGGPPWDGFGLACDGAPDGPAASRDRSQTVPSSARSASPVHADGPAAHQFISPGRFIEPVVIVVLVIVFGRPEHAADHQQEEKQAEQTSNPAANDDHQGLTKHFDGFAVSTL